jgi:hypothetical protein
MNLNSRTHEQINQLKSREDGRVESDGRPLQAMPLPSLPLIELDVQISRIRPSCRPFVIGLEIPVLADIDSET